MHQRFRRALVGAFLTSAACSPSSAEPPRDAGVPETAVLLPAWSPVLEHLDGALLSVWGMSERDVWTVGGPLGNAGLRSLVMRFDGELWRRADVSGTETFWWVHGTSPNDVWLVGERGRITHFNGSSYEEKPSGTTATLFGIWAAAPNDAWAVGGLPDQNTAPVILHWNGVTWSPEVLPEPTRGALFKIFGASSDDLYAVGEAAMVWHRTQGVWRREAQGLAGGRLTTVTGCSPSEVFAVGGRDLLTSNAGTWSRASDAFINDLNGIACAPLGAPTRSTWGRAVIVGGGSLKLRLTGEHWESDFGAEPFADLHGAWGAPSGAFWGVGGNFNAAPKAGASREGVVARYATDRISSRMAQ